MSLAVLVLAATIRLPGADAPAKVKEPEDLFSLGQRLFEDLAPAEVKARYEFPTRAQFDAFMVRLTAALEGDSLGDLAAYLPEAKAALAALRAVPGQEDLADWLEQRLDEMEAADQVQRAPGVLPPSGSAPVRSPAPPPAPKPAPVPPPPSSARPSLDGGASLAVPHYDLWLSRVRGRPVPARASTLLPRLKAAFAAEGVPPELVWLAEAESSLNPEARSPAGAKGLFQFTADTAKAQGLSTFLPDERAEVDKSAHAAARLLRSLHTRFGNWPLAFAAYNAGEGRVSRLLAARRAKDFAGIAEALPAETRMYVPKVCALIATRTGVAVEKLKVERP
jgi:membrane-bound lytic murein transglycosylase D